MQVDTDEFVARMLARIAINSRAAEFSTFHPFSRLPTELRIKIWGTRFPELYDRLVWARKPGWIRPVSKRVASALLSVSIESRDVYLTHFPMGL
ncbi:hypothetical protein PG994_008437 [Apiospora phragmitis]|uniref:2EXR domain-containing protein n=1 Tax=Apiospora phragmitis TaxID=2905665 RepID=A0ABR1UGG5_9PEZI